MIADQGREFVGREFADRLGHLGVPVHYISARAPWENGRTERAGGIYKSRLETAIHEVGGVTSEEEFKTAISETSMMHNRYYNRSGYTTRHINGHLAHFQDYQLLCCRTTR